MCIFIDFLAVWVLKSSIFCIQLLRFIENSPNGIFGRAKLFRQEKLQTLRLAC